jgi:hypothetical protein
MPVSRSNRYLWLALAGAGVIVAVYIYLYVGQPLPGSWNETLEFFLTALVALSSAVTATLIWRHFPEADRGLRRVWGTFALGFWLWTLAEIIFFGYALANIAPPLLTVGDAFWLVGYIFVGGALVYQYRLVYRPSRAREGGIALGLTAAAVIISLGVTALMQAIFPSEESWLAAFVSILYPFLDLAVGLAALWLVYAFGGRLWSRPWLGLFVFAIADVVYAWLVATGVYDNWVSAGNPLGLVADVLYLCAYLVAAIACLSQLLVLRYGLPPAAAPEPEDQPNPPAAGSPAPPPSQPPASS